MPGKTETGNGLYSIFERNLRAALKSARSGIRRQAGSSGPEMGNRRQ